MLSAKLPPIDIAVRTLRFVHAALVIAAVFYVLLPERLLRYRQAPREISHPVHMTIVLLSIGCALSALSLRQFRLRKAERVLVTQPDDIVARRRWHVSYLMGMCVSEAIVLYGLVLRFMSATLSQVAPFYIGGIFLLLLFFPRRPSSEG